MKQLLFCLLCLAFCLSLNAQTDPTQVVPDITPRDERTPGATPAPAKRPQSGTRSAARTQNPPAAPAATPAPAQQHPTIVPAPALSPAQTPANIEKPLTESAAVTTKRKLIADGFKECLKHEDYGKVYCKEASGEYVYIDEDGIAVPIDAKIFQPAAQEQNTTQPAPAPAPISKTAKAKQDAFSKAKQVAKERLESKTGSPAMVAINRWVSPIYGDWESIPESHVQDAILVNSGFKNKTFQYNAYLTRPSGADVTAVYRWTNPTCNMSILLGEHELTDTQLLSFGYKDKVFQFYAYKIRPAAGRFVAVSRWVNALPEGDKCRDFTLSVAETEYTDAQLTAWGYSSKLLQFYVPDPR